MKSRTHPWSSHQTSKPLQRLWRKQLLLALKKKNLLSLQYPILKDNKRGSTFLIHNPKLEAYSRQRNSLSLLRTFKHHSNLTLDLSFRV
jgi:hypothetical protein